jgi:hypothetical protein
LDRNEFGTENLGLERFYSLNFSIGYSLTRNLQFSVNSFARRNEYLETDEDRDDDRVQAGCSLTYTPLTWLSFRGTYSHNLLRSSEETNDYDENVAMLTLSLSPRGHRYDY